MEILASSAEDGLSTFDEVSAAHAALEEKRAREETQAQEAKANADIESLQALDHGVSRYDVLTDYFTRQMASDPSRPQASRAGAPPPGSQWEHLDLSRDDGEKGPTEKTLNDIQDVCDQIKESTENTEKRVEDLEVKVDDTNEELRTAIRATQLAVKANQSSLALVLSMLGELQQAVGRLGARPDAGR